MMKNNAVYYPIIIIPLILILYALYLHQTNLFAGGILAYVLVYRPLTDGYRLISRGILQKSDRWKMFIPLYNLKWQRHCY